jgi:transcriptional regulator with XRE-family HTH domain
VQEPAAIVVPKAVKELRTALGDTQEAFAARMHTVVRTISRWESVRPPKGAVLEQLAKLAIKAKRVDLATIFEKAQAAELKIDPFTHRGRAKFTHHADDTNRGILVQWLEGDDEQMFGQRFYDAINGLRHEQKGEAYRQALAEFAKRVEQIKRGPR